MTTKKELTKQVRMIMETGECDLPIIFEDVARRVAHHPDFTLALQRTYDNKSLTLRLITESCAISLCKEFLGEPTE